MSYTQMNTKYSTVENTLLTKSDVLVQGELPNLSKKYQVLQGSVTFSASAAGNYAVLDNNNTPLVLQTGSYIDKVLVYQGVPVLSGTGATFNVGLAASSGAAASTALLSGNPAAYATSVINQADPNSALADISALGVATLDAVKAGISCHPDVVVVANNWVSVTTAAASVTGKLNVLLFVASP